MEIERIGVDESVSAVFPPAELIANLEDVPPDVVQVDGSPESLADCQAVVTFVARDSFLELDWVHSIQAGVDRFSETEYIDAGVILTNSSGIHGDAIGETVAGYVLSFGRRLHEHVAHQTNGEWSRPAWDGAWTIAGERACVVGLGGLGRGIVDRLTGLGLDVVGVRRSPTPEPGVERVYPSDELHEAISDARFVILAVPLTDDTSGMIGAAELHAMSEDAYLVNVARGGVVDQKALVDSLEEGNIAGAALDVFETEPLPESSPLWDLEDVIVTPHCAALTEDYYRHIGTIVRESIGRFQAGEEPVNRVL